MPTRLRLAAALAALLALNLSAGAVTGPKPADRPGWHWVRMNQGRGGPRWVEIRNSDNPIEPGQSTAIQKGYKPIDHPGSHWVKMTLNKRARWVQIMDSEFIPEGRRTPGARYSFQEIGTAVLLGKIDAATGVAIEVLAPVYKQYRARPTGKGHLGAKSFYGQPWNGGPDNIRITYKDGQSLTFSAETLYGYGYGLNDSESGFGLVRLNAGANELLSAEETAKAIARIAEEKMSRSR